jgi:hypothetical protein
MALCLIKRRSNFTFNFNVCLSIIILSFWYSLLSPWNIYKLQVLYYSDDLHWFGLDFDIS